MVIDRNESEHSLLLGTGERKDSFSSALALPADGAI